jgi:hypothetical protein
VYISVKIKQYEAWLLQGDMFILCSRSAPREGAYVHGLFMEGAKWDIQQGIITESRLKELFPAMPVVNIRVSDSVKDSLLMQRIFCLEVFYCILAHKCLCQKIYYTLHWQCGLL